MTNYYVYYKVNGEKFGSIRSHVRKIFRQTETLNIHGRWMRRRDDPSTYMEVYEGVSDAAAFEALLDRSAKGFAVPRRVEVFRMADLTD